MTVHGIGLRIVVATVLFALVCPAYAFTIAVSPARFEERLTARPQTRNIKVVNYGRQPTTVRVRVAHFDLDENNKVREIAPTKQSLDQWIIVRPLEVTIPPGKAATVRFAIRPLARPTPGEHRAMIFLEQLASPKQARENVLNVSYRLGVAVYGYAGGSKVRTKLHGFKADGNGYAMDIESLGNAHSRIKGTFGLWSAGKYPGKTKALTAVASVRKIRGGKIVQIEGAEHSGVLPGFPVLPGYRRTVLEGWRKPLAKGTYHMVAKGTVGELPFTKLLTFKVQ